MQMLCMLRVQFRLQSHSGIIDFMLNIDFLLLIVSILVEQYEVTTWEMVYVTVSKLFSSLKCREVVGQMLGQNWTAKCMWGINLLLQTTLSHETITI